jgi:hypothetical protein
MKYFLTLLFFTFAAFAIEEGTFLQYKEVEQQTTEKDPRSDYHYPFLDEIKAPTKQQELSLQQKVVDYFGTFVSSSPFPGVRATFEGTELMSSLSSVNKDLELLLQLQQAKLYLDKNHIPYPEHPRIFLSGQIEMTGFIQKDATGHPNSDIDLTDTNLDFLMVIAPWIYGYIGIEYDNSLDPTYSEDRIQNSRIHGDSIFVTIGDFTYCPWYLTLGQVYIPFGQYTTYNAIHDPLTKILFRTLSRIVQIGFYNDTLQCAAYVYKGSSHADSGHNINNYGINLGGHFQLKKLDATIAVGLIRNVADSIGMQAVFGDAFNGEDLHHVVPGINANGNFTLGNWTLLLAYNQVLRPFSERDTTYSTNGTTFFGPKPQAFDIELAYAFKILKHASSIALSYTRSYEALAFNVPKERINMTWATYVYRGCLLSFEFNSDKLYDASNRVNGKFVTGNPYFINPTNLGHRDFSFGIDFLCYF